MKQHGSLFLVIAMGLGFANISFANHDKCPKMVYSKGWLTKYQVVGNTWGANTKRHGAVSSTAGSFTEHSTAFVDPGVTTGRYLSSTQYTSSFGACSLIDTMITEEMRIKYIDQNILEIKKQIALGEGHHLDSLAVLSGCEGVDREKWLSNLQNHTMEFYDSVDGKEMVGQLRKAVNSQADVVAFCPGLS